MSEIHHMTVQRISFILPEDVNPVIGIHWKKSRMPRKKKKKFFKLHGYKWMSGMVTSWYIDSLIPYNHFRSKYICGMDSY